MSNRLRNKATLHSWRFFAVLGAMAAALLGPGWSTAGAQQPRALLAPGDAAVTGFSGALAPVQIPPGVDPAEETFIDIDGPSLRIVDLQSMSGPPLAQIVGGAKPYSGKARDIGQVFGVALDDATPPNIYVAASSTYGLPIVAPGPDNAARHIKRGAAGVFFMVGLWGRAHPNGGPGSIWKIDGASGAVSLFANVALDGRKNSGPALGGLAYDAPSKSLFVVDRETGMVHRFDPNGAERDRYDHGQTGRKAQGLEPVAFDAARRLDVESAQFDSTQPATWNYARPERLVFALAVAGRRLYYSVASGLQIWSVGLADDGSFEGDARVEIVVPPAAGPTEISKIAFDEQGRMFLAERPAPTGAFDFEALTPEGIGRVLRYAVVGAQADGRPLWQPLPTEYPIGFARDLRNANGGVAIGYSYNGGGRLMRATCGGFLWASGEDLRDSADPAIAQRLRVWGPANVDGLQGEATWLAMRGREPPWKSYFIDYDDRFDDAAARGHMGDLTIWRDCGPQGRGAFSPVIPTPLAGLAFGAAAGGGEVARPGGARPPRPPRKPPVPPPTPCATPGACPPPPHTCPQGFTRRDDNNQCQPQVCPAPSALIGGACCTPGAIGTAGCSYCPSGQVSVGASNYCCSASQVYTGANGVTACCAGTVVNGQCQPGVPPNPNPQCAPGTNNPNCCASGYAPAGNACCLASQITSTGLCCPSGQSPSGPNLSQCLPGGGGNPPPGVCCPAGQAPALNGQCCATTNINTQGICCALPVNPQSPGSCPAQTQAKTLSCASGYTRMSDGLCCRKTNISRDGKTCLGIKQYPGTPLLPLPVVRTPPTDCGARGAKYVSNPADAHSCIRCPRGAFANEDHSACLRGRGAPPPRLVAPPQDTEPPPRLRQPRHYVPPPEEKGPSPRHRSPRHYAPPPDDGQPPPPPRLRDGGGPPSGVGIFPRGKPGFGGRRPRGRRGPFLPGPLPRRPFGPF